MKILIIRYSSLGDIVLTQPVVAVLRERFPDAELHYLTKPSFLPLLRCFPEELHALARDRSLPEVIRFVREQAYDLVIDLQAKLHSAMVRHCGRAGRSVAYDKAWLRRRLLLRHWSHTPIDSTVSLYYSALARLGIDEPIRPPVLRPTEPDRVWAAAAFAQQGIPSNRTVVGIFPGAAHPTKQYPNARWAQFIDLVPPTWNCEFVIAGSFEDKQEFLDIRRCSGTRLRDITGLGDTGRLVALIDRMDAVLSNDSGPMHVAAALGKPQIALFGATHSLFGFRPMNDNAVLLETDLPCRPCSLHGGDTCKKDHFRCMRDITPEKLLFTFRQLLEDKVWHI